MTDNQKKSRFEAVSRRPPQRPDSPPQPVSDDSAAPAPQRSAGPLQPGEQPKYAGLRRDRRGIVVGAQGLVMVRDASHSW
jgi:hypothetical protein